MRSTVIRERSSTVERMQESKSVVAKPRVPQPVRHSRGTRGAAVSAGAPRPKDRIASVNRDGRRVKRERIIANRHRDGGAPCNARAKTQKRNDSHRCCQGAG